MRLAPAEIRHQKAKGSHAVCMAVICQEAQKGKQARHTSTVPRPRCCTSRFFLDNVAGWILELDRGQGIPFEGNYSQWLEARATRMQGENKQQAGLQRAIDAELEFVRSKAKGQQKKGKARMRRYDELVSQVIHPAAPWQPPSQVQVTHAQVSAALCLVLKLASERCMQSCLQSTKHTRTAMLGLNGLILLVLPSTMPPSSFCKRCYAWSA